MFFGKSLRNRIIVWFFIPTVIILVAVALVAFTAYQRVTQTLVMERDKELTRLAASQLAGELAEPTGILTAIARLSDVAHTNPILQQAALERSGNRLVIFDGGVLILDTFGRVSAAHPRRPEIIGQDWSDRSYFRELIRSQRPVFSNIVADGPQGAEVVVIAVPISGAEGEFLGGLVGMFQLRASAFSAFYGSIIKLRLGESGSVYLVDATGRVIYHSNPERIGMDYSARQAVQQVLAGQAGAVRTRDTQDRDVVAGFALVPGTPWGLVTQEPWANLTSGYRRYEAFLLLLLALGMLLPVLVVTIGVGKILRPIHELIEAAQEVARGNFGRSISAQTGDEIEELGRQFNAMSAQLQASYAFLEQRVADRTRALSTLNTIASVVSRSLELDPILCNALSTVVEALGVEAGAIYLKHPDTHQLHVACHCGLSEAFDHAAAQDAFALSARAAERGEPVIIDDLLETMGPPAPAPTGAQPVTSQADYRSLVSIPMLAKGQVEGVLTVASLQPQRFGPGDIDLLSSIGNHIGVAIENARLYQQAQDLAVVEERQRLARELHDSVTQALYGAVLYAKAAAGQLSLGQLDRVAEQLAVLQEITQQALAEMRLLIYELRPPMLEKVGLVAALQARLQAVEGRAGLRTDFRVEGVDHLPHPVEEGLYRIAQEALNNVLKHAHAHYIGIHLCQDGPALRLEIADDGAGFDPAQIRSQGGMGLSAMEERAAQLGGRLQVHSQPGAGTRVLLEMSL